MEQEKRDRATDLREKGWMITAISEKLQVAKSTVSLWVKNIPINPTILEGRAFSRLKAGEAKQRYRKEKTKKLFSEGFIEGETRYTDSFFVSGLMLYWAEGAKSEENIRFVNSDPEMICFMIAWFKKICHVSMGKFRGCVHIHNLHKKPDIENYWSEISTIPRNQFYKTQIKKSSLGHRKNKLYQGTFTISIGSKDLFRKMKGWRAGILAKMNENERV